MRRSIDQARARDVEPAGAGEGSERLPRADVAAGSQRIAHAVGEDGRVAESQVEPLGPDGRNDVRRLSDEGDAVAARVDRRETGQWKELARADLAERAQQPLEARLESAAEGCLVHVGEAPGDRGPLDPHEARAETRRGHHGERSSRPVEFRRDAVVRTLMRERAGERALLVAPCPRRNAGCGPACGVAAVGTDDEARCDCVSARKAHVDLVGSDEEFGHAGGLDQRDPLCGGQHLPMQGVEEHAVGDVVAVGLEPDLGGGEQHFRGAQQRPHVVEDADRYQRLRVGAAVLPRAEDCAGTAPSR